MIVNNQNSGSDRTQSSAPAVNNNNNNNQASNGNPGSDSDSESAQSSCSVSDPFGSFTANNLMVRLEDDSRARRTISQDFNIAMGPAAQAAQLVAVHKPDDNSLKPRRESFAIFEKAVAEKCGGNSNTQYALYGGSRDQIIKIVRHGFDADNVDEARRVQLSPYKFGWEAAKMSTVDEDGFRHMLLCRVIVGKTEVVPDGDKHFGPRLIGSDSGVDDIANPRRFYVWSEFMNSHILPNFVLSFRAENGLMGHNVSTSAPGTSVSGASVSLGLLLPVLERFISPEKFAMIKKNIFEMGKREDSSMEERGREIIQRVAEIVNDDRLLSLAVKSYKGSQPAKP